MRDERQRCRGVRKYPTDPQRGTYLQYREPGGTKIN